MARERVLVCRDDGTVAGGASGERVGSWTTTGRGETLVELRRGRQVEDVSALATAVAWVIVGAAIAALGAVTWAFVSWVLGV